MISRGHRCHGLRLLSWFAPALVLALSVPAAERISDAPPVSSAIRLSRIDEERTAWTRDLSLDRGSPAGRLTASPWFPPAPDVTVHLLDGTAVRLESVRGRVVLLDFWASWCVPCRTELPKLQALAADAPQLLAIAVNAEEPEAIARRAAAEMKLSLPLGSYDEAIDTAFHVRSLPTVILIDRQGRMRDRWDGYGPGLEDRVAQRVRELMGNDPEGSPRELGAVLEGGGLEGRWVRELTAPIGGIAAIPAQGGTRLAVRVAGALIALDATGSTIGRLPSPEQSGRLLAGDLDGRPGPELIGWRRGSPDVAVYDIDRGEYRSWKAPTALLGLDVLPARPPERPHGLLLLGGSDAVFTATPDGAPPQRLDGSGPTASVAVLRGPRPRLVALDLAGHLRSWDETGHVAATADPPAGSDTLAASAAGSAAFVGSHDVTAIGDGHFVEGAGRQIAAASPAGLAVLDEATGAIRLRARTGAIDVLLAADLDGDGVDELLAASGRTLAVFGARRHG